MRISRSLALALRWPTFLFAVFCLYWSLTINLLTHNVKWLWLNKKRNDVLGWAVGMRKVFRFKALKVGKNELCKEQCMYLCNHRSWADFLVDQYVTEGRSLFLSRWAVLFVFPMFMIPMRVMRSVFLFKRGTIPDKEKFNRRIDAELANSPQIALAVYPEGHRSTHGESLPLKRGMIHYAHSRKMPIQVVIGANKEAIVSEKHKIARLNQTVAVGYSEVIRTDQFKNFEDLMAKVQETWDNEWNTVFTADWTGLPEIPEPTAHYYYPKDIEYKMLIVSPLNILAGVVTVYYSVRLALYLASFLGPLQTPFWIFFALYVAAGFYVYSEPVDALTVHENLVKQVKKPANVRNGR